MYNDEVLIFMGWESDIAVNLALSDFDCSKHLIFSDLLSEISFQNAAGYRHADCLVGRDKSEHNIPKSWRNYNLLFPGEMEKYNGITKLPIMYYNHEYDYWFQLTTILNERLDVLKILKISPNDDWKICIVK